MLAIEDGNLVMVTSRVVQLVTAEGRACGDDNVFDPGEVIGVLLARSLAWSWSFNCRI